jgi:hypothetical protein
VHDSGGYRDCDCAHVTLHSIFVFTAKCQQKTEKEGNARMDLPIEKDEAKKICSARGSCQKCWILR